MHCVVDFAFRFDNTMMILNLPTEALRRTAEKFKAQAEVDPGAVQRKDAKVAKQIPIGAGHSGVAADGLCTKNQVKVKKKWFDGNNRQCALWAVNGKTPLTQRKPVEEWTWNPVEPDIYLVVSKNVGYCMKIEAAAGDNNNHDKSEKFRSHGCGDKQRGDEQTECRGQRDRRGQAADFDAHPSRAPVCLSRM